MDMFLICCLNGNNDIFKINIGGLKMSDEFLKTIQTIQATGQAPVNQTQTTKDSTSSAKLITESKQPTNKTYRFVMDAKTVNTKNNKD